MNSNFQKSAKVSLSAAAVGNGGESKQQSSPTHQPPSGRQKPLQGLGGGYLKALIIKAAHCTARTYGRPLAASPGAAWDGGTPRDLARPAGRAFGRQLCLRAVWVLGFRLRACVRGLVTATS